MSWGWFAAPEYAAARSAVQHLVALVYLVAFVNAANEFRPLLGSNGLTPIPRFCAATGFRRAPSLFQLHYTDRFFSGCAIAGAAASTLALLGVVNLFPLWASMLTWFALWALYLSIVNVGQIWYAFGWESLLLETGFLVIFLGPAHIAPPAPMMWLLCWLLFRVEFGAGLIKMRGDPAWRDLTALHHHHETQPMPGPLSRFFHHLPGRMHKTEVVSNHAAQLVLPFGLFLPQPVPDGCALLIIITQLWLMLSGNFAWLNALTIVLAVSALDDSVLGSAPAAPAGPLWHTALVLAVGLGVLVLSAWPVRNMLGKRQVMNASFNKLHLGNTYGAFGSITRVRHEVILEGTADATGDTGWREYRFKGKPGDPTRRSPQVAPYHLRLDWAMWFLPIAPGYGRVWFPRLIRALLQGDEELTALLRENPFAGEPPRRVRARLFRYRFTTARERRETGAWWSREPVADFFPATSLSEMD
jgi:hypothetical protein